MPLTYDLTTRQYSRDGVIVTAAELRAMIDTLSDETRRELRKVSAKREKGLITTAVWQSAVLEILTAAHVVAVSVGRGGLARMTAGDWDAVDKKVAWQGGYLERWSKKIARGTFAVATGTIAARAVNYASSVYPMYMNTRVDERKEALPQMLCLREIHSKEGCSPCLEYADMGWISVDDQPEIGELECGDYDLCTILFQDEVDYQIVEGEQ